jgi:hypothetical protein
MRHQLINGIEHALGWSGAGRLGEQFARGTLPDRAVCERLLTPTKLLDLVMRRSLTPHRLRCLVNGTDVHPQDYFTMFEARGGQAMQMADMYRIGQLIKSGCTLVLNETNTYDAMMEVACRALQWWTSELAQVNVYLTTGQAAGFQLHWDDHDVIIVQLDGEKSWEVRGLSRRAPMYRDATPNLDPPEEIVWAGTLRAGDVMHIPRGYWHQATRQDRGDGFSLHATFGFTKRTGVHWLSWLADQARSEELFRHDLSRGSSAEEQAEEQRVLAERAQRLLAGRPLTEFLALRERQQGPARHVATHGVFGLCDSVVCVTEFPPDIEVHDTVAVVRGGGKEVTVHAKAVPAIRMLLGGEPVDVAVVTAATGVDAAELARVFVEQGLCAEATPELLSGYAGLATGEVAQPTRPRPSALV